MQPQITEKIYEIHYHETDPRKRARITSLMNFFDDTVLEQSNRIGYGLEYFEKNNLIWVLLNWDIKINRLPVYEDSIVVKTYPHSMKKCYGYRKYEIGNRTGEIIVRADSAWVLLDKNLKKPVRVPEDMCIAYGINMDEGGSLASEKISPPERIDWHKEFNVRYGDIDANRHVNNATYVEWALETVPMDLILNYDPVNIKIRYKKETKYGGSVNSFSEINYYGTSAGCRHKITDKDENDLCILNFQWEKTLS